MTSKTTLFGYYKKHRFNPTAIDISKREAFEDLWRKRLNLYVNKLQIPQGFWTGKSVLDVGCSSGENALVLAHLGAHFTFIEPMESSLERLRVLFKQYGLTKNITQIIPRKIQDVRLKKEAFDFIIAEGFLFTLQERRKVLNQLLQSLKPFGLISISTIDPVGCFAEYFKRMVFVLVCRKQGISSLEGQLELSAKLFKSDYDSIPHSRPFESWIRDNFINPAFDLDFYWSIGMILKDARVPLRVYSSWPRIEHANDVTWYKDIESVAQETEKALKAYTLRLPTFFHGLTPPDGSSLPSLGVAKKFQTAVISLLEKMRAVQQGKIDVSQCKNALQRVKAIAIQCPERNLLTPIIQDAARVIDDVSVKAYSEARNLRKCWGVIYPYHVLQKIAR